MTNVLTALAYLLPALALLAMLACRRYPGERALVGKIQRARRKQPRSAPQTADRAPQPRALVARGGRLIACALAVRPPPGPRLALS